MQEGEDHLFTDPIKDTTAKTWGRSIEQLFIWNTINILASITQHEVFGHGYRLRELGITPKKYTITPWGGATYFHIPGSLSIGEFLAIDVAGLEAESILARNTKMNWIREGAIDGRLSTLYTQSEQSAFFYTLITSLGEIEEGNDVANYITLLNILYPNNQTSIGKLTRWSLFNLLDPMTFFAYYSWFYYISEGTPWTFPMIRINENIRYLPNIRIGYAPYGPEAYLENFFSIRDEPLYAYVKGGKRSAGIGLAYDRLLSKKQGTVGIRFDGWHQSNFITNTTFSDLERDSDCPIDHPSHKIWGAALSLTATLNCSSNTALFAELGGKTRGYLPGYTLGPGIVARIGMVFGKNNLELN